jgi:hypothetical protein
MADINLSARLSLFKLPIDYVAGLQQHGENNVRSQQ